MIVKTTKTINGTTYEYTYSDAGFLIERDGALYEEAVDPIGSGRTYTETDAPIATELTDSEALEIIMGEA